MTDGYQDGDRFSGPGDERASGPGDARFGELLRDAAQDYNQPPATPRELMWSRIEAARRGLGTGDLGRDPSRSGADRDVIPLRRPVHRHWVRWGVGIAAALALGFGLGRWNGDSALGTRHSAPERTPDAATTARTPSATPTGRTAGDSALAEAPSAERAAPPPTVEPAAPREQRLARAGAAGAARGSQPSADAECTHPPTAGPRPSAECRVPSAAYTLAAIQHLTQAEALLTSFRAESRGGEAMDAQLAVWAKDLLVSTRLMLDSPAGRDARMRRLLEDLELVLAQIAQLGAPRGGDERNLIDEAVEGRNVLPRLRTTIPAGARPVGS